MVVTKKVFNIIQLSNPLHLCACTCELYSTFLIFIVLQGSLLKFNKKSRALLTQLSPSNTKVSLLPFSNSNFVKSRLYLPANFLLNRLNVFFYGLALSVLCVSRSYTINLVKRG